MQNCSMVVGPKLHFTDLNPTGNLKYFRGNLYAFQKDASYANHINSIYKKE